MRDFNEGFRHLGALDEALYRSQGQTGWTGMHLGFALGIVLVPLVFLLLGGLPPVIGALIFSGAVVLALALILRLVIKARRGDFRTPLPPRQRYLDAPDLNPDIRREALRNFRFRR